MSHLLITTLGKVSRDNSGRYKRLAYRFENGFTHESSFFMLALLEYLKHEKRLPDKILVMGTASSMWDALLELTAMDNEGLCDRLLTQVQAEAVTADTLQQLGTELSRLLQVEVLCVLIPMGRSMAEQSQILRCMADATPDKATVTFDVTHGFRILPILELLAMFYLMEIRQASIADVFYGAAEMIDKGSEHPTAPVIRLDFVLRMWQWLSQLPIAEKTGRYDALAELFPDQPDLTDALREHSLQLRTNQTLAARGSAQRLDHMLAGPFADPVAELYRPVLQRKLNWGKSSDLAMWQILSARAALRAGDFLRAVILLREARISLALPASRQNDQAARDAKLNELNRDTDRTDELLNEIRNCLAHASSPGNKSALTREVKQLLQDESALTQALANIADELYHRSLEQADESQRK